MIQSTESKSMFTTSAIRAWLATGAASLSGPRVDDALRWARARWDGHELPVANGIPSRLDECQPDNLYALARAILADPEAKPTDIVDWYNLVAALKWPSGGIDERLDLQTQLAYCASRQFRRAGDPASSWTWEGRSVALALQLPSVPEFMSLSATELTGQLQDRFLSDPCVLLVLCARLPTLSNMNPTDSLMKAISAREHVARKGPGYLQAEERAWFLAQFEMLIAVCHKHLGRYSESEKWLELAERTCDSVLGSETVRARIEFVSRSVAYETGRFERAQMGVAQLTARFQEFGMERYVGRCTFLDGISLKDLHRFDESLCKLRAVAQISSGEVEPWLKGLSLAYAAEVLAKQGQESAAFKTLAEAWVLLKDSNVPIAIAHFHGVKGEILRDGGQLEAAIYSYRFSISFYESAQVRSHETSVRLILAETLLAAGRHRDAIEEIVTALPIIETLGLVREAVVAVALLRESLSRHEVNSEALRTLKRELQELNRGGQA